jgi:hypothetical protein
MGNAPLERNEISCWVGCHGLESGAMEALLRETTHRQVLHVLARRKRPTT